MANSRKTNVTSKNSLKNIIVPRKANRWDNYVYCFLDYHKAVLVVSKDPNETSSQIGNILNSAKGVTREALKPILFHTEINHKNIDLKFETKLLVKPLENFVLIILNPQIKTPKPLKYYFEELIKGKHTDNKIPIYEDLNSLKDFIKQPETSTPIKGFIKPPETSTPMSNAGQIHIISPPPPEKPKKMFTPSAIKTMPITYDIINQNQISLSCHGVKSEYETSLELKAIVAKHKLGHFISIEYTEETNEIIFSVKQPEFDQLDIDIDRLFCFVFNENGLEEISLRLQDDSHTKVPEREFNFKSIKSPHITYDITDANQIHISCHGQTSEYDIFLQLKKNITKYKLEDVFTIEFIGLSNDISFSVKPSLFDQLNEDIDKLFCIIFTEEGIERIIEQLQSVHDCSSRMDKPERLFRFDLDQATYITYDILSEHELRISCHGQETAYDLFLELVATIKEYQLEAICGVDFIDDSNEIVFLVKQPWFEIFDYAINTFFEMLFSEQDLNQICEQLQKNISDQASQPTTPSTSQKRMIAAIELNSEEEPNKYIRITDDEDEFDIADIIGERSDNEEVTSDSDQAESSDEYSSASDNQKPATEQGNKNRTNTVKPAKKMKISKPTHVEERAPQVDIIDLSCLSHNEPELFYLDTKQNEKVSEGESNQLVKMKLFEDKDNNSIYLINHRLASTLNVRQKFQTEDAYSNMLAAYLVQLLGGRI